ncbi:hypothetical protein D3C79_1097940 [compost metagenome]
MGEFGGFTEFGADQLNPHSKYAVSEHGYFTTSLCCMVLCETDSNAMEKVLAGPQYLSADVVLDRLFSNL